MLLCSYSLGAVPSGFLVARMYGVADIRNYGSGNIGATNVARILGFPFFIIVFLLDAGKAFLNLWMLQYMSYPEDVLCIAAGTHLFANSYSPFLSWSGGKGVSALFGLLFVLRWYFVPAVAAVWLGILCVTHTPGIASVAAVFMLPFLAWFCDAPCIVCGFCFCAAAWVIMRHTNNLRAFFAT